MHVQRKRDSGSLSYTPACDDGLARLDAPVSGKSRQVVAIPSAPDDGLQ